jgi:hypothetical protein
MSPREMLRLSHLKSVRATDPPYAYPHEYYPTPWRPSCVAIAEHKPLNIHANRLVSIAMPTQTKNSLNIRLTEPVVFLRGGPDATARHGNRVLPEDRPTGVVRGLLTLDLVKPTRISSIEVELVGKTSTSWPEGEHMMLFLPSVWANRPSGVRHGRTTH